MTFANDIFSVLNTGWDATIIRKPKFSETWTEGNEIPGTFHITAANGGTFDEASCDNTLDGKSMIFQLIFTEVTQTEAEKTIRAAKKALHSKTLDSSYYHIDKFEVIQSPKATTVKLEGRLIKMIGVSEF